MSRPYVFPDPNDRSPNDPSIIVSTEQVLGIYNQDCDEDMQRVTAKVMDWFKSEALAYKWDEVTFVGNQCILKVNLDLREVPNK